MDSGLAPIAAIAVGLLAIAWSTIRFLREDERAVVYRLGRPLGARGPGIVLLLPFLDRMVKVSLAAVALDVPSEEVVTRDGVPARVGAVVSFRVTDAGRASGQVGDYWAATAGVAQTALRTAIGQLTLGELRGSRSRIDQQLQRTIDEQTARWGVTVTKVEVGRVELPQEAASGRPGDRGRSPAP